MDATYKCLIVDDEKLAHLVIQSHISHCSDLFFAAGAFNGKEAIQLLLQQSYDIVFLDIDMPLINGIEVMQTLPQRPATIITTAYNHFAFDAYQHDAVDYLLKPISLQRFLKSVEKAKTLCNATQIAKNEISAILLKVNGFSQEIKLDQIVYFQSLGNYVKVFLAKKQIPLIVYDSLKNLIEQLPEQHFIQIHKSFIINIKCMLAIEKENIILSDNQKLPLGRKYELMVSRLKL